MSGTRLGGQRAVKTIKKRFGEDFYREIGRTGGRNSHSGGFASDKVGADGLSGRQRAVLAGKKGGKKSTRLGIKTGEGKRWNKDIEDAERVLEEERGRNNGVA